MITNKSLIILFISIILVSHAQSRRPHVIDFRYPNLNPESIAWDQKSDQFVVGSSQNHRLVSVSDAGVTSDLIPDDTLPTNASIHGLALDPRRNDRLLAAVHCREPPYNALAAYHLPTRRLVSLTPLPDASVAGAVAADYAGNSYVADSESGTVFKVTEHGEPSILSRSRLFESQGLNGVVYNPKGYLLATQSDTGKLFKIDVDDGTARTVNFNGKLTEGGGIAVRRDGVVLVVSTNSLYFLKSSDSWSEGVVFDETALDEGGAARGVAMGAEDRVYVLYGGNMGNSEFRIVQVESEKESREDNVWIFVLIGMGLVYFLIWRFQMRHLVTNMNKKTM